MTEVIRLCKEQKLEKSIIDCENVSDKCTPYMLAVLCEQFEIATLFEECGLFNKEHVNIEGRTVMQIAEDRNRVRPLAFL